MRGEEKSREEKGEDAMRGEQKRRDERGGYERRRERARAVRELHFEVLDVEVEDLHELLLCSAHV